ncbi:MAG: hypothetical protein IJE22_06185, partial [Oscillibacter sp.]|nr:hypothetical protein [Oscillibacter sp.]
EQRGGLFRPAFVKITTPNVFLWRTEKRGFIFQSKGLFSVERRELFPWRTVCVITYKNPKKFLYKIYLAKRLKRQ